MTQRPHLDVCPCAFLVAAVTLLPGCADVAVLRVTDANRDTLEGFRYYVPRPYVAVKKPFAVAGDDFFVPGTVAQDGSVVEIEMGQMPPELGRHFPDGRVPFALVTSPVVQHAHMSVAEHAEATPSSVGVVITGDQAKSYIEIVPSDPQVLTPERTGLDVQVKLKKAAPFTEIAEIRISMVPLTGDGTGKPDKAIRLSDTVTDTAHAQGSKDGVYKARIRRADVTEGPNYALGLSFRGKQDQGDETAFLVYIAGTAILAQDAPPPPANGGSKAEHLETPVMTTAGLTLSGDPRTNPLQSINNMFDIVYLPDFEEQYAVSLTAGTGLVKATLGLENGWMTEYASVEIDNRELGKFIYSNVEKLVDLGVGIAKDALLPGASAASELAHVAEQADAARRRVLLRIRWVAEAQPGLYPILKKSEKACTGGSPPRWVLVPYPPFTVVAYHVRHQISIELVNTQTASLPAGAIARPLDDNEWQHLVTWLGAQVFAADSESPKRQITSLVKRLGTVLHTAEGTLTLTLETILSDAPEKELIKQLMQTHTTNRLKIGDKDVSGIVRATS